MNISILFPSFCDGRREPDPEFYKEVSALDEFGIRWGVVDIDALLSGDVAKALRYFDVGCREGVLIYRGWILHPGEYTTLYNELVHRGWRPITNPDEYCRALLFPEYFPAIREHSFAATWITGCNPEMAWKAAELLGPPPYFIKDYAKSAKEIWPQGCIVSAKVGEKGMADAIKALRDYRGDRFESGIVIRPFVRLNYIDENPFGGAVFEEYRLFFFRGKLISKSWYGRAGGDVGRLPDYSFLSEKISVPFFSADIVRLEDRNLFVLEIGDGGSSALPPTVDPIQFYRSVITVV